MSRHALPFPLQDLPIIERSARKPTYTAAANIISPTTQGTVAVMVGNKVLQGFLTGNEGGLEHIVQQVDPGADGSCLRIRQVAVHIGKDLAGFVQLLHHDIQVIGQNGEAAHDDQTCHRNTDCREGHEAVEENAPDALFQ